MSVEKVLLSCEAGMDGPINLTRSSKKSVKLALPQKHRSTVLCKAIHKQCVQRALKTPSHTEEGGRLWQKRGLSHTAASKLYVSQSWHFNDLEELLISNDSYGKESVRSCPEILPSTKPISLTGTKMVALKKNKDLKSHKRINVQPILLILLKKVESPACCLFRIFFFIIFLAAVRKPWVRWATAGKTTWRP